MTVAAGEQAPGFTVATTAGPRAAGRRSAWHAPVRTTRLPRTACLCSGRPQSPPRRASFETAWGEGGARGWIRFADNGPGIAPQVLERLTREPVTTRGASGGNGMGLMFCQRVMQDAGGAVRIESAGGMGTTVSLEFQRAVQPVEQPAA